jgi:aspartyl/glutamyl-tRNA(Asn/Gln) amidotransferase C subunit
MNCELLKDFALNSKIKLTQAEEAQLLPVFNELFENFKVLDGFNDLGDTAPLITVSDTKNALREDVAYQDPFIPRDYLLASAIETHDGSFVVPKTVE